MRNRHRASRKTHVESASVLYLESLEPRTLFSDMISMPILQPIGGWDPIWAVGNPIWVSEPIFIWQPIGQLPIGDPGGAQSSQRVLNGTASSSFNILDHRKTFTGPVASFTDTQTESASTYSATLNWGDGSPVDNAAVVANSTGGFDVLGSHAYLFGQYRPIITITAAPDEGSQTPRTLELSTMAHVFPPAVAGIGLPVSAIDAKPFAAAVATYIGVDAQLLDRYTATITWGDGKQSAGTLQANSDGSVAVIGHHTYLDTGFDDVSVILGANSAVTDVAASTARSRATIVDGPFGGKILPIAPESGAPFNDGIAFFQFLSDDHDISNLRATVTLKPQSGTGADITLPGQIIAADGGFDVAIDTVLIDQAGYQVQISIDDASIPADPSASDDAQLVAFVHGAISLSTHLSLTSNTDTLNFNADQSNRVFLGHLDSDDPGSLWDKQFAIHIDWGDGSSNGEGEAVPNPDGGYDLYGAHTYTSGSPYETYFTIRFAVTETRTARESGLSDTPLIYTISSAGMCHLPPSATATVGPTTFTGFQLFTYSGNAADTSPTVNFSLADIYIGSDIPADAQMLATIQWSDGVTSTATINFVGGTHYIISASRDATAGDYDGVLTVDIGSYEQASSVSLQVYTPVDQTQFILNADITPIGVTVYRGDHFHGLVATFTTDDPSAEASDFSAGLSIQGAANTTTTITRNDDGTFSIIADFDAQSLTPTWWGYIPDASLSLQRGQRYAYSSIPILIVKDPQQIDLSPASSLHFRQREQFTTTVATFTSQNADATPDQFSAVINWGDGITSTGVITKNFDGTFDISGDKAYKKVSGSFAIVVTLTDPRGKILTSVSGILIDRDPVSITPTQPDVNDNTVSGKFADFIDEDGESTDPDSYRVYHAALINWGDGQISAGIVQTNPDGTYSVVSSHTYTTVGDFTIDLRIRRNTFYLYGFPQFGNIYFNGNMTVQAMSQSPGGAPNDPTAEFGVTLHVHIDTIAPPVVIPPVVIPPPPTPADPPAAQTLPTGQNDSDSPTALADPRAVQTPSADQNDSDLPSTPATPRPSIFSSEPIAPVPLPEIIDTTPTVSLAQSSESDQPVGPVPSASFSSHRQPQLIRQLKRSIVPKKPRLSPATKNHRVTESIATRARKLLMHVK